MLYLQRFQSKCAKTATLQILAIQFGLLYLEIYQLIEDSLRTTTTVKIYEQSIPRIGKDRNFQNVSILVHIALFSFLNKQGFGEKGGQSLCMTGKKLAFVNLDNYMYSQVYGNGPTDPKEPLYHSNPFWLEVAPSLPNTAVGVYLDTVAPVY